jgi:hypothetical protein
MYFNSGFRFDQFVFAYSFEMPENSEISINSCAENRYIRQARNVILCKNYNSLDEKRMHQYLKV